MLNSDPTPTELWDEIQAAVLFRDDHLANFPAMVRHYHSHWYYAKSTGDDDGKEWYENHYHDWISLIVPRIAFNNPKVKCKTRLPGLQAEGAQGMEWAYNAWIKDVLFGEALRAGPAVDMQFNWGVMMTVREPVPGSRTQDVPELQSGSGPKDYMTDPREPRVYRISQQRYIEDPLATCEENIRWRGHLIVRSKESLKAQAKNAPDEGWNLDAIENLCETTYADELRRPRNIRTERDDVIFYEIWIPSIRLKDSGSAEEGFHGTIFTVAETIGGLAEKPNPHTDRAMWLRQPRPFYGRPKGPYSKFGVYTVPDRTFPLSPLLVVEGQVKQVNDQAWSVTKSNNRHKQLAVVTGADANFENKIKSEIHDGVVGLQQSKQDVAVYGVQVGGATETMVSALAMERERLQRVSGMNDAMRGTVTGQGTATENAIADSSSQTRIAHIQQAFERGVLDVLDAVGWYFWHDKNLVIPLGEEANQAMGLPPGVDAYWEGGRDLLGSWTDLQLEIEPYSMERTNEARLNAQTQQLTELCMAIAGIAPAAVNWKMLSDLWAETMNRPDLDGLINEEILVQAAGAAPEDAGQHQKEQQPQMRAPSRKAAGEAGPNGWPGNSSGNLARSAQTNEVNIS